MAEITFYLYPASNQGSGGTATVENSESYDQVDDAYDAIDGRATFVGARGQTGGTSTRWMRWGLTPPQTGVVITKIRVHYAVWSDRGGVYDFASTPTMKGCLNIGGTYYTSNVAAIVGATQGAVMSGSGVLTGWPFYRATTAEWQVDPWGSGGPATGPVLAYWEWTTNPATALAWTIADLQNLQVVFNQDGSKTGGNNVPRSPNGGQSVRCTACYVKVFATQVAASIEEKRLTASAYLRLHREPTDAVEIALPAEFADADVGDILALSHELGPAADAGGWGPQTWQRHHAMLLSKRVDPSARTVTAEILDLTRFHCGLWFPAITDLGYTEEGQGVPYLDAGGGRSVSRSTVAYVQRQLNDYQYVQVPADKEKWTPEGLSIEDAHVHLLLNSSFSQAGSPHANWTNSIGGSGVVSASGATYLFDASGLRRSCTLNSIAAGSANWAGVYQTFTQAAGWMRAHFLFQKAAAGTVLYWRLQRSSDSWWWNDSTGAWQSGGAGNLFNPAGGLVEERYSKPIQMAAGVNYTLYVYAQGDATNPGAMYLFYADVFFTGGTDVDMVPTPVPTTTAKITTAPDLAKTVNPASALSYNALQGTGMLRAKIRWDHDWMADLDNHTFLALSAAGGSGDRDIVWYRRDSAAQGTFYFSRMIASTAYTATVVVTDGITGGSDRLPAFGDELRIAWRWQQAGGELGKPNYSIWLAVRGPNGTTEVLTAEAVAVAWTQSSQADVWYGHNGVGDSTGSFLDGRLSRVEVVPYVLPDVEVYRRLQV